MNTTAQPVSAPPPPRPSRRKLGWALLGLVGLAALVGGTFSAHRQQNSVARTAVVVAQMQSGVQALSSEAVLAARGNAGAIDRLRQSRASISTLRGLLRTGGYAAPSDPAPVLILEGRPGFPLQALDAALAQFDEQQRQLEESAARLRQAAEAEESLARALGEIEALLPQIQRTRALSSGAWGQSLSDPVSVLSRQEMRTMRVIFAPLPGADSLQAAWSTQFKATAARLEELAAKAERDPDLPPTARTLVKNLSAATAALAQATATLAQAQPDRLAAQRLQAPILDAAAAIQAPLSEIGTKVLALGAARPLATYLSWLGMALVLISIAALARAVVVLDVRHWAISQDSRQGLGVAAAVERMTVRLRHILAQDGQATDGVRLQEDPSLETFALSSMINSLLDAQDRLRTRALGEVDGVGLVASEAIAPTGRIQVQARQLDERSQRMSALARAIAQDLARQAQDPTAKKARRMVELTTAAELVMQEGTNKMDAMRETVQATSKRLKRLAEGAQSIAAASVVIDEISRRVKVLSTNAAIEAAAHGEGGRKFAVLAKEIERLSQSAHQSAVDIGQIVAIIQNDAQETVATMERSTSEVVASTELAQRASQAMREIEHMSTSLVESIQAMAQEVEKQAVEGLKLSQGCDQSAKMARELSSEGEGLARLIDRIRSALRDARNAISTDPSP